MDKPVKKVQSSRRGVAFTSRGDTDLRLGILAKAPVPGTVKTRLCPPLQPHECALFHALAVRDTVATLQAFRPVIFYSGDPGFFRRHCPGSILIPQPAGDLGVRLDQALRQLFDLGARCAALIGSDSPDLPPTLVGSALQTLDTADVCTIPARDGGYVLIGARRPQPELFTGMPWSTPAVLAATRERCAAHGLCLAEIGLWEDVDEIAGLARLAARAPALSCGRYASRLLRRQAAAVIASGCTE